MSEWNGKSIGPLLGYKIFIGIIKIFGLNFTYFILRFVTFYYFLFAKSRRKAIVEFYMKTIGLSKFKALKLAKRNFYIFGQTLVDRNAFLLGKGDDLSCAYINEERLVTLKEEGNGAVLLSAHLGNWETAGNFLKHRISNKINVLMLDEEYKKIKEFINEKTGGAQFNIIPLKNDLSHVIKIKNALNQNEFVAIHSDRHIDGTKAIEVNFFNHKVNLPYGPFLVASKFKVPVVFVFAVKETKKSYTFCSTDPLEIGVTPEVIANAYIKELERMVTKYPEQWFNYYNYFKDDIK